MRKKHSKKVKFHQKIFATHMVDVKLILRSSYNSIRKKKKMNNYLLTQTKKKKKGNQFSIKAISINNNQIMFNLTDNQIQN